MNEWIRRSAWTLNNLILLLRIRDMYSQKAYMPLLIFWNSFEFRPGLRECEALDADY